MVDGQPGKCVVLWRENEKLSLVCGWTAFAQCHTLFEPQPDSRTRGVLISLRNFSERNTQMWRGDAVVLPLHCNLCYECFLFRVRGLFTWVRESAVNPRPPGGFESHTLSYFGRFDKFMSLKLLQLHCKNRIHSVPAKKQQFFGRIAYEIAIYMNSCRKMPSLPMN